jgi:hypothetical protein
MYSSRTSEIATVNEDGDFDEDVVNRYYGAAEEADLEAMGKSYKTYYQEE